MSGSSPHTTPNIQINTPVNLNISLKRPLSEPHNTFQPPAQSIVFQNDIFPEVGIKGPISVGEETFKFGYESLAVCDFLSSVWHVRERRREGRKEGREDASKLHRGPPKNDTRRDN